MGGRGVGSGGARQAVRRVTEQLLRLALDPPEAPARADEDDGADDVGVDVDDAGTRDLGPGALVDVAPERAASALLRALETEKYADVRAAVVAALPRVRHPARFALACVERLAARRDDGSESSSSAPVVQLLLESLGQACAVTAPRPAFAAVDAAATRVEDPVARAAAARILARVLRDALHHEFGRDDLLHRDDDAATAPALRLEPRAVARLAAVVGVDLADLNAADAEDSTPPPSSLYALHAYAGACLGSGVASRVSAAASLARHFSLDVFATPTALDTFDDVGHGALADAIAACLPRERRDAYLRRCSRRRDAPGPGGFLSDSGSGSGSGSGGLTRAERAARAMRRMGLAANLPEESKLREETRLRRLCADGRWDVAERLAGEDASHRALVRRLRDEAVFGSANRASDVGRDVVTSGSTTSDRADDVSSRRTATMMGTAYLALDLPADAVCFADDEVGLASVSSALRRDRVVGVDTEWRPETTRGAAHRTALMQLAGTRTVAVLDLPKLAERCPDALAATIREVLCETRTDAVAGDEGASAELPPVCAGFGVEDDLRRAARSYPGPVADAIASIPATVCLQTMAGRDARFAGTRAGSRPSLSAATERVLGAPLDKRETTGDWERRPLAPAQMAYAALDARVLVRLFPPIALGVEVEDLARDEDEDEDAVLRRAARAATAFATPASSFLAADRRDGPAAFAAPSDVDGSLSRSSSSSSSRRVASLAPLPASRVADALRERLPSAGGDPTVLVLPADTGPSAAETAAALGPSVAPEAVVKSIGVIVVGGGDVRNLRMNGARTLADALGASGTGTNTNAMANAKDAPAMVLLRGTDRCDLRAVAAHFGVSRRRVRLATPAECVDVFGYPPGSMPPFGLRRECATVMDAAVREYADGDVFPGAGAPDLTFRCLPAVLERAAAATTAAVAETTVAAIRVAASAAKAAETRRGSDASPAVDWGLSPGTEGDAKDARRGVEETKDEDEDDDGSGEGTNLKFVTDGSLGRLARWLRALGVDAEHVAAGAAGRHDALLALAARDDRVILTRDRRLMARREAAGAYLVDELDPKRQLAVVSSHFGLRFRRGRLLTRCAKCNGEVETRLSPEDVAAHPNIPDKVKRSTNEFWACGRCRKVYWVGPKSHKAVKFIQSDIISVLAGSGEDPEAAEAREIVQEALGGNPWPRGDEGEGGEE